MVRSRAWEPGVAMGGKGLDGPDGVEGTSVDRFNKVSK